MADKNVSCLKVINPKRVKIDPNSPPPLPVVYAAPTITMSALAVDRWKRYPKA